MGNEASLEGGGQPGETGSAVPMAAAPGSISAPPGSGQLTKPSNGAPAGGGPAAGPGPGINSVAGRPGPTERAPGAKPAAPPGDSRTGAPYRLATHESPAPQPAPGQGQHAVRRTLQVDVGGGGRAGAGRSPAASPDRCSAPASPYSVPQIAPMPSSKLCPVCNTTELTAQDPPNSNACTQCRNTVCNQCGFNPNPHLTQVQEWLCLNCQMQRALGMDMTTPTPRSKSQQQIHSPSHQAKPDPQAQLPAPGPGPPEHQAPPQSMPHAPPQASPGPQRQARPPGGAMHTRPDQRLPHPPGGGLPGLAKAPSQPDLSRPAPNRQDHARSAGSSPSKQPPPPQDQPFGKLFGFGASLLNQASTLISVDPTQSAAPPPSPAKPVPSAASKSPGPAGRPGGAPPPQQHTPPTHQQTPPPQKQQAPPPQQQLTPKTSCPLCKTALNVGSTEPPNYNSCTQCHTQVCNLCGFNPTPHLLEKKEWLCLNCQTQRLMSGSLADAPPPQPSPKHQPMGSPQHQAPANQQQQSLQKGPNQQPGLLQSGQPQQQRLAPGEVSGPFSPAKQAGPPVQAVPAVLREAQGPHQALPKDRTTPKHPATMPKHQEATPKHPATTAKHQETTPKHPMTTPKHQEATPKHPTTTPKHQEAPPKQPTTMAKHQEAPPKQPMTTAKHQEATAKQPTTTPKHQEAMPKHPVATPKYPEKEPETKPPSSGKGDADHFSPAKDIKREVGSPKSRHSDEGSKPGPPDVTRSPQSLSDTGYSSDGISSSHSEITGLIQEEGVKLSERGVSEHSPPSPSEITKLESSMRPLLESKTTAEQERGRGRHQRAVDPRDADDRKQRPHSLSVGQEEEAEEEAEDWDRERRRGSSAESSDDLSCRLRHDYVEDSSESGVSPLPVRQRKGPREATDEDFMRRQIMEMSADEDELEEDEGYGYVKPKKSHKHAGDSGKEKRRLTQHSNSYEEDSKGAIDDGEDGLMAAQGGLRRFKTIELNNSNSYNRDIELSAENDLTLDREPELEMESLTGSPDERSRGEYSSTLPATTPSYTSGTSPTSVSSMEEDSDSSPSRRQRLEEAKQQRKARHRSHGPLLPTIEDSSEEDELREEEELLREQEKMREVEQQRIRSTARKTKRDKEELRAQRRRERSKTPPSNLSPIEDASPTEELRQAAEMEELHRSSCSEYSPSIDSEAEGFEMMASKLYKSGSEYNLPTFMSLYSPTEKPTATSPSSIDKPLKSAEEVYEEMMRKAEMLQKQQRPVRQVSAKSGEEGQGAQHRQGDGYSRQPGAPQPAYRNGIPTKIQQSSSQDTKQLLDTGFAKLLEQNNALLTPGTSPTQLSSPVSFSGHESGGRGVPDVRVTQHFVKEGQKDRIGVQAPKTGVVPVATTTVATYGVYTRDTGAMSQTTVSQIANTTQSSAYVCQMGTATAGGNVSSRIAEMTQSYSQRESPGRRAAQVTNSTQATTPDPNNSSLTSRVFSYFKGPSPPLSPSTSPTQSPTHSPSRMGATEPSKKTAPPAGSGAASPVSGHGTQMPHRAVSPRLSRQQSSQDSPFMVITLGSEPTSPSKPVTVNSATSPITSPTRLSRQLSFQTHAPTTSSPSSPQHHPPHQSPQHGMHKAQPAERIHIGTNPVSTASSYSRGSLSMENISLCRISTVPGTSRVVEQGQMLNSGNVVDLRTPMKPAPIIMTEQGMDLTSLASDTRRYSVGGEGSQSRHTAVQPLIMNLNAQEQPHVVSSTATTVSVTVAASMFISQPKQPVVYGDPLQNRVDLGQGVGSAVCLTQNRPPPPHDPFIPKIDACLEDLGIQQQQLQKQQQKLQQQQQQLEEQLQQHQQQTSFARYNLANQVQPMLLKKDLMVSQTSGAQAVVSVSAIPRTSPLLPQVGVATASPALPHEMYGGAPLELKNKPTVMNLSTGKPHIMVVQLDDSAPQGATVTQLVKPEQPPPQEVLDLTGQIKTENQVACCDVVYKLPFTSSCTGPFAQKAAGPENNPGTEPSQTGHPPSATQFTSNRTHDPIHDSYRYQEQGAGAQGGMEERKLFPLPAIRRLQPSISDTNLAEAGLQSEPGDLAVDLSTMKQAYEGGYLGMGVQYGSYTDLRHQGDIMGQPMPLRRYGSMSNINTDLGYSRDLSSFQESNLAQYSATTAREISRMCAALNSMDQFGGRYGTAPELLQYGCGRGGSPASRLNLQHNLMRANLMLGSDGRQSAHAQAYANLINARQASIRALYPSTVRAADGMIYSTINTPIASTLPITTQPASVLRPMLRGVYRPYPAGSMTAVPLASLTRLPLVTPRMPLSPQGPYQYPSPNRFSTASVSTSAPATTTALETPVYLGKPSVTPVAPSSLHASVPPGHPSHLGVNAVLTSGIHTTAMPIQSSVVAPTIQQQHLPMQTAPLQQAQMQPQTTLQTQPQMPQPQTQPQVHPQMQAQMQPQTQMQMQSQMQPQGQPQMQPQGQTQPQAQPQTLPQAQIPAQPQTLSQTQAALAAPPAPARLAPSPATTTGGGSSIPEKKEEDLFRQQQQEQLLQLERERVELEKLRQLRLHEELERDRLELQRHREKEQMLVQREIQELQTIKQQVLQQQQVERETQLVMQREQLAQQRAQLDQIQSLQQQLQQQLEEQKRQKTVAAEAAAAAAAAEAAAASAAAVAATTAQGAIQGMTMIGGATPQGFSIICDQSGRVIQQDLPPELQKTMSQNGQFWQPYIEGHSVQGVGTSRLLPSSASEMSLRSNEEAMETRAMKKRNSMPRLRDGVDGEENPPTVKRIADSSVQTDDEEGEERFLLSRRRRTRRIADCSVQTDDEDQSEWEQPVRRRRSRFSKHSEPTAETKTEAPKVSSSSIAIQTTTDSSCQTEPEQLGRVSPAIHITTSEPKVEFLHYISAPERTQKGESLACQTEPEPQSQGVVAPQLSVPTTISPYSTSMQLVGSGMVDPLSPRQQGVAKFERRKPDPLEISYQTQLHNEPLSNMARQPPKSPQVLYSPVSPMSPHRLLETSFSSSERLNKAHVTPQKHFTAESPQRHQTLPRPIKNVQRSMSDPKPLSPTSEDSSRTRFSLYQQQVLQNSQLAALQQQQNLLMRKVKRTLPSPPPEETPLPIITPALPQMYASPSTLAQRGLPRPSPAITKAGLLSELKAVEQESTKLRKQQAELEEEEKEIDAKLRYLELGITQRKERERRELAYMRCMGDGRDYASDSELNNVRMLGPSAFEGNNLLAKSVGGAPLSQFPSEQLVPAQYPPSSSFLTYQYPQSQSTPPQPQPSPAYQQVGFQPPQYPTITQAQPQPGTFQPHPSPLTLHPQGTYTPQSYPQSQASYQTDLGVQPSLPGFQPPPGTAPYPGQTSYQSQSLSFQPQAEILSIHQKPRQTSLADLEQKIPTNYEVISNPTVVVTTSAQDGIYSGPYAATTMANSYGQYRPPEQNLSDRMRSADSPTSTYASEGLYTNLEQNIPRNYVMIDDISELTKENMGACPDMHRTDVHGQPANGRYSAENGPTRTMPYGRTEEDLEYSYGTAKSSSAYHQQGPDPHSRTGGGSATMGSPYYYDDYNKHPSSRGSGGPGVQKHSSKSLAPAVVSSKRSKHRKQGMEQKISKFSPIEEARDVESDLASYTITTPSGGSCTVVSRAKKLQDDITHGLKKNVYEQQKYYGTSSREALEEEDRMYGSGRSRSTGYGMDKISSRDSGYRSKSYERDTVERAQRGSHGRGRPSMRPQHSEEESPLSPVGKPMGVGRGPLGADPQDSRNQYGSSHSLPDVQDHMKDVPRSHVYKPDDPYLVDDMHCAVSDSEAYHLGQEETDWFEKPREARSDRSRHYAGGSGSGSGGHSSSGRRSHVKHTYHDYDEPPEEDLWPPEDYGAPRHTSSSSREHRHHGGTGGRHSSSSRHSSEDPRSSRSSRGHNKDSSSRPDSRGTSSSSTHKRGSSSQGHHSGSDYPRDPAGHQHGSGGGSRPQKQQPSSSRRQDAPRQQQQTQQRASGGPVAGRQPGPQQQQQQQEGQQPQGQQLGPQPGQQPGQQQQGQQQGQQPVGATQPAPAAGTTQPPQQQQQQQQARPGLTQTPPPARQPQAGLQASLQPTTVAKTDPAADASKSGVKPGLTQAAKPPQVPLTGIGSKAAPRPGGIGSAAAGQPGPEGDLLSKILPGNAAEQAGKLGDAVSALGKKFTSFW